MGEGGVGTSRRQPTSRRTKGSSKPEGANSSYNCCVQPKLLKQLGSYRFLGDVIYYCLMKKLTLFSNGLVIIELTIALLSITITKLLFILFDVNS